MKGSSVQFPCDKISKRDEQQLPAAARRAARCKTKQTRQRESLVGEGAGGGGGVTCECSWDEQLEGEIKAGTEVREEEKEEGETRGR